jgi:hypothetical protein
MMRLIAVVTIAAVALLGVASSAIAQRRDASDRGQRMDSEEFRNDMNQNRLRKPTTPQVWQAIPDPGTEQPPKRRKKQK